MITIVDNDYSSKSTISTNTILKPYPMDDILQVNQYVENTSTTQKLINNDDVEDVPLLVSDSEDVSDGEDCSTQSVNGHESDVNVKASIAAEQVKRDMKLLVQEPEVNSEKQELTKEQFRNERNQLMTIVVKYIATKITNSFPPQSPSVPSSSELPLDRFLLILTNRLQLSLPLFMKGIIYLFRYMDIIYLLRYLNQSNNFANYNEMDFCLKKLIVGCFKLALSREKITKNWSAISGMSNGEINTIVKTIVTRMNGKLVVKNIDLLKLKLEIFRFVKMVTNPI